MHTWRKILPLLLLAAIAVFSCKKSKKTSVDNKTFVDNIAGTYVGEHYYHRSQYGGLTHYHDYLDTTITNDTFIIVRLSIDSFFIYTNSVYTFNTGGWGFRDNDSNFFVLYKSPPPSLELKFVAGKDSIYYDYGNGWSSGVSGSYFASEKFYAKKVSLP